MYRFSLLDNHKELEIGNQLIINLKTEYQCYDLIEYIKTTLDLFKGVRIYSIETSANKKIWLPEFCIKPSNDQSIKDYYVSIVNNDQNMGVFIRGMTACWVAKIIEDEHQRLEDLEYRELEED